MSRSKKHEAKRKRNNLISGLVIIFLMVFSILAFPLDSSQPSDSFEYNGFVFNEKIVFEDQLFFQDIRKYSTVIDGEEINFFFTPGMMSQVNTSYENLSYLSDSEMVLFSRMPMSNDEFDSDYVQLVFFDFLSLEFQKNSFKQTGRGLLAHSEIESDFTIVDCDQASLQTPVFLLSNETDSAFIKEIEPFCFEVGGDGEDLLLVSDYLIYKVHRVI